MNTIPARYPKAEARVSLAARCNLPYYDDMQDWEWEVADSARFEEFLATYCAPDLNDDERFSLMEILVQCVEDLGLSSEADSAWDKIEPLLLRAPWLHGSTIEYWACCGEVAPESQFNVSPHMRSLYASITP
jgi:hypothetical protein